MNGGPKKISNRRLIKAALLWDWKIAKANGDWVVLENPVGKKVEVRSAQCHTGTSPLAIQSIVSGSSRTDSGHRQWSPSWEEFTQRLRDEETREEEERLTHGTVDAVVAELLLQDKQQEEQEAVEVTPSRKEDGMYYRGGQPRRTPKTLEVQILDALRTAPDRVFSTREVFEKTDSRQITWVSHLLARMAADGRINRVTRGGYSLNPNPVVPDPEPQPEEQPPVLVPQRPVQVDAVETVDAVLDLFFPDGVKMKDLQKVLAWREGTIAFLKDLS